MEAALIAMLGVCAALFGLSALIIIGMFIVKRLKLPNDPPLDALFSCPAPALIQVPDRERALAQAAEQQAKQAVFDQAKEICIHALKCREAYSTIDNMDDKTDEFKEALNKLKPIYKKLKDIPEQLETWHKENSMIDHAKTIEHWCVNYQEDCRLYQDIVDALPEPSKKRIYYLIIALLFAFALMFMVQMLANNT